MGRLSCSRLGGTIKGDAHGVRKADSSDAQILELSEFGESIEVAGKRIVVDVTMCGVYADHMSDGIDLPRTIDRLGFGLARRHFFCR